MPEVPPCWLPVQYRYCCCGSVSRVSTMNIHLQIRTPAAACCSCWHVYDFKTKQKMQFTIKWTLKKVSSQKGNISLLFFFFKSPKKHAALPSTHASRERWHRVSTLLQTDNPSDGFPRPIHTELPSPQLGDWSFQGCLTDLEMNISKFVLQRDGRCLSWTKGCGSWRCGTASDIESNPYLH